MTQTTQRRKCGPVAINRGPRRGPAGGFTLVEMVVVLAVLAVLMAIIVPTYQAMAAQNRRSMCAANMKAIGQALALFRDDYGCFPPDATEFVWTEEALEQYRSDYGADPPGDSSVATLVGAAYDPDGNRIDTGVRGMGLFTLYYLGAYAPALPPDTSEPRLTSELRAELEADREGLNGLPWFRGSGYLTKLETFHCPSNNTELQDEDLVLRDQLPYLGGWNNYDVYYRRNFWAENRRPGPDDDNRNLFQPYPPADTVVTWCPHHRTSGAPSGPGVPRTPNPGDQDLVLFADGTVRRMTSQKLNRMFEQPPSGAGWPEGPIM